MPHLRQKRANGPDLSFRYFERPNFGLLLAHVHDFLQRLKVDILPDLVDFI